MRQTAKKGTYYGYCSKSFFASKDALETIDHTFSPARKYAKSRREPFVWFPDSPDDQRGSPLWKPLEEFLSLHRNLFVSFGEAGRERYIGEGGFVCGSKQLSASPMPHSLGTFLAEQESTAPGRGYRRRESMALRPGRGCRQRESMALRPRQWSPPERKHSPLRAIFL